jgi:protein O-GlcNAc transferase
MTIDPNLQAAYDAHRAGNLDVAAALYGEVLRAEPRNFDALCLLGLIHLQHSEFAESERLMDVALQVQPYSLDALYGRSFALHRLGRNELALDQLNRLLSFNAAVIEAWLLRGKVLREMQQMDEALKSFDETLARDSGRADTWNDRASVLLALGRPGEALASYERGLALEPRAELFANRGNLFSELGRFEDAAKDFDTALRLDPDIPYARGSSLFCKLRYCDWESLDRERQLVLEGLAQDRRVIQPGEFVAVSGSAEHQLKCARVWVSREVGTPSASLWQHRPYRHDRIRVAYVSADFRSHAILQLMAGVFEEHDKARFDVAAVSLGADDQSRLRKRAAAAFGHFIEAGTKSDSEVARLIKDFETDIAVDLMGFTSGSRSRIFSQRPAPVQVNYLGFPGTMGADYLDYIIADRTVIPVEAERFYAERIVRLPDTFQANDLRRPRADRAFSRIELGLPENGFVFCCFNNHFKIWPEVFGVWIQLLKRIEGSVLWLLQNTDEGARNLRREAEARGVAGERLIFAPRMEIEDHIARHRQADLFLDTLPCNSGTTASDALWAGLPVLTCIGTSFAGRVAASLLRAGGLPELITSSLEEYAATAAELALDREKLSSIKEKLSVDRASNPLFDTKRFTRHLEAAFTSMWERHERGESPAHFAVEPLSRADQRQ